MEHAKGAAELKFFFKNDGKYLAKNEKNPCSNCIQPITGHKSPILETLCNNICLFLSEIIYANIVARRFSSDEILKNTMKNPILIFMNQILKKAK